MNHSSPVFSRHNAIFLGICLGGLALLVGLSILPLSRRQRLQEQEIAALSQELAAQRRNQTAISMVDGMVAKLDQQPTPKLVAHEPLARNQTGQIADDIRALAHASSLTVAAVEPQLDKGTTWQTLTIKAEVRGLLPELRDFLLKVLALPYVNQIQHLEIHSEESEVRCNLTCTIDLA